MLKPRRPFALPVLCRADGGTNMTKRAGRVTFSGRLAQLVRAAGLQRSGRGIESLSAHSHGFIAPTLTARDIGAQVATRPRNAAHGATGRGHEAAGTGAAGATGKRRDTAA